MALALPDNVTTKQAFGSTTNWLRIDTVRDHEKRRVVRITPSAAALYSVGLGDGAAFDATIAHPLPAAAATEIPVPSGDGRILVGCTTGGASFAATCISEDYR